YAGNRWVCKLSTVVSGHSRSRFVQVSGAGTVFTIDKSFDGIFAPGHPVVEDGGVEAGVAAFVRIVGIITGRWIGDGFSISHFKHVDIFLSRPIHAERSVEALRVYDKLGADNFCRV